MTWRLWLFTVVVLVLAHQPGQADVFRWDNGEIIPGTQGIDPGPGVQLDHREEASRNLRFADLSTDLTGANFTYSWLENARFTDANLANAMLAGTKLSQADFTDAWIEGAALPRSGITYDQLASTASFKSKNLRRLDLSQNTMSGWNLSGQNLSRARLSYLPEADLSGANLTDARFETFEPWVYLGGANFDGAIVNGTYFGPRSTSRYGFSEEQLKSTASYRAKNLSRLRMHENDLTGWDFRGQNLTSAEFWNSTLTNADFSGAIVEGTQFGGTGLTQAQLASTASYQSKDLSWIGLAGNDLTGWNLSGYRFQGANFEGANAKNVDLRGADLTASTFFGANLSGADLSGAKLANATLWADDLRRVIFSSDTTYNQFTQFPFGYDPVAAGLTFVASPVGDFNANDSLDIADLELLQNEHNVNPFWLRDQFDLNDDNRRDLTDVAIWVKDLKRTWFGDVDLDGEFNSSDLLMVFESGQFEDDALGNSTWSTGDWNKDGDFTTSDLTLSLQDGGYGAGPRAAVAVSEPMNMTWLALAGLLGPIRSRYRHRAMEC